MIFLWICGETSIDYPTPIRSSITIFKALRRKLIRDHSRTKKFENGVEHYFNSTWGTTIEDRIIEHETSMDQRTKMSKAISRLPNRQKEAINLLIYEEFSYDMVANIMGINLKSVYNLACKAIASLRKELVNSVVLLSIYSYLH